MYETPTYVAGEGPLTYGRVLRQAWGMLRVHYRRVALVAMVLFAPPPLLAAALRGMRDALEADPSLARGLGYLIGLLAVPAGTPTVSAHRSATSPARPWRRCPARR